MRCVGKPPGPAHLAMMQAVHAIAAERKETGRGATLAEIVQRACVLREVGYSLRRDLLRSKKLRISGFCKVAGRNKEVAEYLPVKGGVLVVNDGRPAVEVCISGWLR